MTHLSFTGFDCLGCRAAYAPDQDLLCPTCHHLLEARYDLARLGREVDRDALARRPAGVWRWRELLPVLDPARIVTLGEGGTPFLRSARLARACGVRELWLKSDASNPTGSLKDRSITVSATKAVEFGYGVLSCDSTGNKASSTAAYAARAGLRSVVFCPKDTPVPKMAQAVFFGARLIRVDGHYSQINAMYRRLIGSGRVKWYDCGTDNPFRYEGKKFRTLGWTDALPKMTAVQAARCAPIVASWKKGLPRVEPVEKQPTIASAVAAADPGLLGDQTLAAVRASGGDALAVEDAEIVEAVRLLGEEGLMIEPSGAVTVAAVRRGVTDRILDLVEVPRQVVSGYEAMLAEAERI
ncbi:MAG TPA: pyridoxal-phosphate dependent enzyme [Candidatus Deferrimicrobiaceae bacterium]|nr:pyridoxal-phosphate dependent enzyme [Candidatus Deferrimicrobiaceae bacterium]